MLDNMLQLFIFVLESNYLKTIYCN